VECELYEFESWDELEQDVRPGGERGFVLETPGPSPDSSSTFRYSDLVVPGDADAVSLRQQYATMCKENERLHLYRVDRLHVLRIERDDAFIASMIARLRDVWDKVLWYRLHKDAYDTDIRGESSSTAAAKRRPRSTAANVLQAAENAVTLPDYAFLEEDL
jgi:hypothetical protein